MSLATCERGKDTLSTEGGWGWVRGETKVTASGLSNSMVASPTPTLAVALPNAEDPLSVALW